jgi:hypothetical protein
MGLIWREPKEDVRAEPTVTGQSLGIVASCPRYGQLRSHRAKVVLNELGADKAHLHG